jgi:hypothetical protein
MVREHLITKSSTIWLAALGMQSVNTKTKLMQKRVFALGSQFTNIFSHCDKGR